MDDLLELIFEVICHLLGVEEKISQKPKVIRVLLYVLLLANMILISLLVHALILLWRDPMKSQIPAVVIFAALLVTLLLMIILLAKKLK